MTTYINGSILEYGLNTSRLNEIRLHNNRIISQLPENDSWPPLSREMFAFTNNHDSLMAGTHLEYTGRLLHFGASLKSVEYEWKDWKDKFEDLLTQMYWLEANVHFKTEYAKVISFNWHVDLKRWSVNEGPLSPIRESHWEFENADNW